MVFVGVRDLEAACGNLDEGVTDRDSCFPCSFWVPVCGFEEDIFVVAGLCDVDDPTSGAGEGDGDASTTARLAPSEIAGDGIDPGVSIVG